MDGAFGIGTPLLLVRFLRWVFEHPVYPTLKSPLLMQATQASVGLVGLGEGEEAKKAGTSAPRIPLQTTVTIVKTVRSEGLPRKTR